MNDPDPDNFSSCSFVKAARRSDSEIVMLDVSLFSVVVLKDCLGRLLLVGRPEPRERAVDLGVGAKLIISLSSSDALGNNGRLTERSSNDLPLGVGANSNAFGCGSMFCCSLIRSSGIGSNTASLGKCGKGGSFASPLLDTNICASAFTWDTTNCNTTRAYNPKRFFMFLK